MPKSETEILCFCRVCLHCSYIHVYVPDLYCISTLLSNVCTECDNSILRYTLHCISSTQYIPIVSVQVPTRHFAGYAQNMVKELYAPMNAAIQGRLQGPGVLGTVLM